ncbi:hypothetical protein QM833_02520 [Streptococcus infantis]|jgi:hypothetical protein|uniref:hypothetical protein n=1 Tax=Streptococcus TaxID=1301 RepID=UPI0008A94FF2|nr:hypothetical protein [Streptococcus sp. HMSC34B10]OHS87304.1 hypothetical protein HMPREF3237_04315 [Streptococcus sp. HMSC34B10]
MSELYLPIRDSLGYQNVKQALERVFSINLDTITINEGEDENFNFPFVYKGYHMTMGISSTGKNRQLEAGEGGLFNIWFTQADEQRFSITFLSKIIDDKSIKRVYGRDRKSVERTLQILKDFLDSDKAAVLLKN